MNYNSKLKEWRKLKKFSTKRKAYYAKNNYGIRSWINCLQRQKQKTYRF